MRADDGARAFVKAPEQHGTKVHGPDAVGDFVVYLLIGGTWAGIYSLVEAVAPGSFAFDRALNPDGVIRTFDLIYFSFTSLTTMGYGDLVPATSHARSFAVLEAIVGVMYLATIISRLVGIYITRSSRVAGITRDGISAVIPDGVWSVVTRAQSRSEVNLAGVGGQACRLQQGEGGEGSWGYMAGARNLYTFKMFGLVVIFPSSYRAINSSLRSFLLQ